MHVDPLKISANGPNSHVVNTLRTQGLRVYEPSTAPAILAACEHLEPFAMFDVGANVGLYSLLADALFRTRSIDAFEPTPELAALADQLAGLNSLDFRVHAIALGAKSGSAQLYRSSRSDTSNSLVAGFRRAVSTVTVPVSTVDEVVSETGHVPSILKVDTELLDADVLAGAESTIRAHRPWIFVEALHTGGEEYGRRIANVMAEHRYFNYELGSKAPWRARAEVAARNGTTEPDWLLAPISLGLSFFRRVAAWRRALEACGGSVAHRTIRHDLSEIGHRAMTLIKQ